MSKKSRAGSTERAPRPSPTVSGWLVRVIEGPDRGKSLELVGSGVVVGTADGCELQLTDPRVSAKHAQIEVQATGLAVRDLGSTNGTFYLETRVKELVVPPGAVLTLGATRLALLESDSRLLVEDAAEPRSSYGSLAGESPVMQRLYATLERVETADFTVLVCGETGTGKELVAREIHAHSARRDAPFEVFDCGAASPNLVESELFGHVRGAFTGADRAHTGVFERAGNGTVFLDEIGELSADLQPKLLRVLESRQIRPVGGDTFRDVAARLVAATHRNLEEEVKAGRFRRDLFFRLNVVRVDVPSLRERLEDIPCLARALLQQLGAEDVAISSGTMELLRSGYRWPGNVRELRNALTRLVSLGALPEAVASPEDKPWMAPAATDEPFLELKKRIMDAFERDYLETQLDKCGRNIAEAARASGMDRSYFRRMLIKHGLVPGHEH